MPFKSKAQRRWMYHAEEAREVPRGTSEKWEEETGNKKIPERKKEASYFWDYEYIPELSQYAIPKELQEKAYGQWKENPSKENMNEAMRTFGKLINSELKRYSGTLQAPVLHSFAKKYMADAIRSYDPTTGNMLSTHIVNYLQRLHRLNYRNVQGMRASEEVQSKIREYLNAKSELENLYGRDPTDDEIGDKIGKDANFIRKLKSQMRSEINLPFSAPTNIAIEYDPKDEVIDFLFQDLPEKHKDVFKYKTGYMNTPILSGIEIAKKLNISPVRVTQIAKSISEKLEKYLGRRF